MPYFNHILMRCWPCLAGILLLISTAIAEELPQCPADTLAPDALSPTLAPNLTATDDTLHVSAERIESFRDEKITLSGNVVIVRGEQRFLADKAVYDKNLQTLDITGNVRMQHLSGDRFISNRTFLKLESNTGFSESGSFTLRQGLGRGQAERIVFVAKGRLKLKVARFTTCPANKQDWYLKASEIELDQNTFSGTARHATLRFMGVPLFYTPYLSFPLGDHRRSGLLLPEFGSTDSVGSYVTLPYYWNIAPDYDATFTPRFMSRRGLQLQSEFRYLGDHYRGTAELEVLPKDAVTGDSRLAASYQHQHQLGSNWTARADIGWVGDTDYFDDFATQLSRTSQSHLSQFLSATYRRNDVKLAMSVSSYQTVDATIAASDTPFTRLPQLIAHWRPPLRSQKLNYEFHASATDFRHDSKESAQRFHLRPSVSFPMVTQYGQFTPRISLYSTAYRNRNMGTDAAVTLPVASIDSGLIFERSVGSGKRSVTQTLEPRMFLLYVPYVNQDALPLFDTRLPTFSFDSLFQENRFIGSDRIGDTQQFTLALTSRIIGSQSGRERISASIGQTFYFSDRQVNIPAGTTMGARSNVAAEITAWLGNHLYIRSTSQWDTQANTATRNNFFLQYQPAKDRILNIGYRFENGVRELVDISTQWPLSKKWTVVARSQYSLKDNRNQDSYAGLLYRSCCWSLRTMLTRRIDQSSAQTTSIEIQLILTGLAGFDSSTTNVLPLQQSVFH